MCETVIPAKLRKVCVEKVWAGNHIHDLFPDMHIPPMTGEIWVASADPDCSTAIKDENGTVLLTKRYPDFPFLLKFIDSGDFLSVQLHPDTEYAANDSSVKPKNEMWYIVHAEPDAILYLGSTFENTEDLLRACNDNSIENHLKKMYPKTGEVYIVPAGTIHSIGPGIVIYEIQEPSSTTFRLYDWDRIPPRELHIEKSLKAFRAIESGFLLYPQKKVMGDVHMECFRFEHFFDIFSFRGDGEILLKSSDFATVTLLRGTGVIGGIDAHAGETFLIRPDTSIRCVLHGHVLAGAVCDSVKAE